jgi:hypothetical protein
MLQALEIVEVGVMSDVFILYAVVCYLVHLGLLASKWGELGRDGKIGGIAGLILAPISIPFTIGFLYKD